MDKFVKELGDSISVTMAVLWGLLSLCDNKIVECPLNQGTLYSTADWEGFILIALEF
jgi:hypothetical protein